MELQQLIRAMRAIRKPEVLQLTGMSSATMWRRIKDDGFPKPFKLGGGRAVAWLEKDISDWLEAQAAKRGV